MSYIVSITCDDCGDTSPGSSTQKAALALALSTGWGSVRHLGKHLCGHCHQAYQSSLAPPKPKRSQEGLRREKWAAKVERMKILTNMRDSGKTFRECGDALGVSVERARQLFALAERAKNRGWEQPARFTPKKRDQNQNDDCKFSLGVRSQMGVERISRTTDLEQAALVLVKRKRSDILKTPNLNKRNADEIEAWLAVRGLTFQPES